MYFLSVQLLFTFLPCSICNLGLSSLASARTASGSSATWFLHRLFDCRSGVRCMRFAFPRSSTLGSARTVSGSSVVGFVYIVVCSDALPDLTRLNANPANYCTVKCPGCRPRLLLCNEPGRQAGSVTSLSGCCCWCWCRCCWCCCCHCCCCCCCSGGCCYLSCSCSSCC